MELPAEARGLSSRPSSPWPGCCHQSWVPSSLNPSSPLWVVGRKSSRALGRVQGKFSQFLARSPETRLPGLSSAAASHTPLDVFDAGLADVRPSTRRCRPIPENPRAGAWGPSPASASALGLTEGAQHLLGWIWFAPDGSPVSQCEARHRGPGWSLMLSCQPRGSKTPGAPPRGREGGHPWATFLDPGHGCQGCVHLGGWPCRHPAYREQEEADFSPPAQGSAPGSVALGGQLDRCDTFVNMGKALRRPRNGGGWQRKSERTEEGRGMGAAGEGRAPA